MDTVFYLLTANSSSNRAQLAGFLRASKAFGWQVRIVEYGTLAAAGENSGLPRLLRNIARLKEFWSPLGIVVDCGGLEKPPARKMFALPTVFLDIHPEDLWKDATCVHVDNAEVARTAARELLSLEPGVCAYVPFTAPKSWCRERERAFAEALRINHFPCHIFKKRNRGDNFVLALDRWIAALPKPAAVFAANDHISELVVDAARRNGLAVPDDIAVIGVDNDEQICLNTTPQLSSIKPDHAKAGALAAQRLKELIANPRLPPAPAAVGPIAVLHRRSTRPLRRHDERTLRLIGAIREKTTTGLSVSRLAREFGVSRRTLEIQFREAMGRSILQEIQERRIEQAKLLLTQTDDAMPDVARQSGYPSVQAFRKHFTKAAGCAPTAFRRMHRP